ncbi:MAG: radical SAM/SPASM domain-containing protein [Chloroflexota bacterium]
MLNVLARVPLYMMFRRFGFPRLMPLNLTLSPSPRCNSRCLTCNIWKKRENELTIEEWDQVLRSLGRAPYWFTLSGGEPFLYRHIVELAQLAYDRCRPGIINIPTNSLLYQHIPAKIERIARYCQKSQVILNLSLDGVGAKHDHIRGVPGNFEKFEAHYRALRELNLPNLNIGIHSVISNFNVADVTELFDYAFGLKPDSYITEIAEERVELDTLGLDITPSAERYGQAIDQLIARLEGHKFRGVARIAEAFRVEYYHLVKRILVEKTQVIGCYAGWASAQIYADGTVWPCCVRADNMGKLRDVEYDFGAIWFSPEAERIRRSIYDKECHCPLANASYTNMLHHPPTLLQVGRRVMMG